MTYTATQAYAFLLVLLRMTGMIVFHPILGRREVPVLARMGLALTTALLLFPLAGTPPGQDPSLPLLLLQLLREMGIGMMAGFLLRLFLSVLIIGGEIVDMQLGIAMSKVFDPASNTSISLSASIYNSMFILIFFITNNHLTFFSLCAQSFRMIPLGEVTFQRQALLYLPELFGTILLFAAKLCLPVVVMEIVVTMAVGIIMRIIPQINVFVVNIQFKLLAGMFVLIVLVAPVMGYFENLILICTEHIAALWSGFV